MTKQKRTKNKQTKKLRIKGLHEPFLQLAKKISDNDYRNKLHNYQQFNKDIFIFHFIYHDGSFWNQFKAYQVIKKIKQTKRQRKNKQTKQKQKNKKKNKKKKKNPKTKKGPCHWLAVDCTIFFVAKKGPILQIPLATGLFSTPPPPPPPPQKGEK